MDRATCLAKCDPRHHAAADAMAAAGVPWAAIFALVAKVLPEILDLFRQQPQMQQAAPAAAGGGGAQCPAEAEKHLTEARKAALQTVCKLLCLEHCLSCDSD